MNLTRKASLGRRVAAVLAVGAVLLGGCDRQRDTGSPGQDPPAAATGNATGTGASGADATDASGSDVNGLLDEVDKQLNADDQPVEDQD
nr:hypothetical protein [uncultured Actinoplanes sp.]